MISVSRKSDTSFAFNPAMQLSGTTYFLMPGVSLLLELETGTSTGNLVIVSELYNFLAFSARDHGPVPFVRQQTLPQEGNSYVNVFNQKSTTRTVMQVIVHPTIFWGLLLSSSVIRLLLLATRHARANCSLFPRILPPNSLAENGSLFGDGSRLVTTSSRQQQQAWPDPAWSHWKAKDGQMEMVKMAKW